MKITPELSESLLALKEKTGVDFSQYQKSEMIEPLLEATRFPDPRWLFLSNFFWHALIAGALVSGFWLKLSLTFQIVWGIGLFFWVFWLSATRALKLTARKVFNFVGDLLPPFIQIYQKIQLDLQTANDKISRGDVFAGTMLGIVIPFLQAKVGGFVPFFRKFVQKAISNIFSPIIKFTNDFEWFEKPIVISGSQSGFSETELENLQNKILNHNNTFRKIGQYTVLLLLNVAYWGVGLLGLFGIALTYLFV